MLSLEVDVLDPAVEIGALVPVDDVEPIETELDPVAAPVADVTAPTTPVTPEMRVGTSFSPRNTTAIQKAASNTSCQGNPLFALAITCPSR